MALYLDGVTDTQNPSPICLPSSYAEDKAALSRGGRVATIWLDKLTARRANFAKGDKVSITIEDQAMCVRSDPHGRTLSQNLAANGEAYDLYAQIPYRDLGDIDDTVSHRKRPCKVLLVATGYVKLELEDDWFLAKEKNLHRDWPIYSHRGAAYKINAIKEVRAVTGLNIKEAKFKVENVLEAARSGFIPAYENEILIAFLQGLSTAQMLTGVENESLASLIAEVQKRTEGLSV